VCQEHLDKVSAGLTAHEDLVHWVVKQQCLGGMRYVDAVQEGRIGLWRALKRYEPRRGRLSGYAVPAIRHAVWRAAKRSLRETHEGLVDEPAAEHVGVCEALEQANERVLLEQMVARLPLRLQQVMVLHYGLDGADATTHKQIGQLLGVTRQRVGQLHAKALLQLADPATSSVLRQHRGRNRRQDIQAYLARRRAWQRSERSGR
jgi:RNA polymerase sigma factor (sigma-70 family)